MEPQRPQNHPIDEIRHPADIKHDVDNGEFHFDGVHDVALPARELSGARRDDSLHVFGGIPVQVRIGDHHRRDRDVSGEIVRQNSLERLRERSGCVTATNKTVFIF